MKGDNAFDLYGNLRPEKLLDKRGESIWAAHDYLNAIPWYKKLLKYIPFKIY